MRILIFGGLSRLMFDSFDSLGEEGAAFPLLAYWW